MQAIIWSDIIGSVIAFSGILFLVWSLFIGGRSRSRRWRCPNCWYDLRGTSGGMTCSECGFTAKREKQSF